MCAACALESESTAFNIQYNNFWVVDPKNFALVITIKNKIMQ